MTLPRDMIASSTKMMVKFTVKSLLNWKTNENPSKQDVHLKPCQNVILKLGNTLQKKKIIFL